MRYYNTQKRRGWKQICNLAYISHLSCDFCEETMKKKLTNTQALELVRKGGMHTLEGNERKAP